ncbi:hypothetical protein VNI00_007621 [Paramarasmius palmivorus]|uniref:Uncharacterized protein n=1 Tax=Paramarasmius palmivorus TaxID=297713 RepID=A0AAW0D627_9AGAR
MSSSPSDSQDPTYSPSQRLSPFPSPFAKRRHSCIEHGIKQELESPPRHSVNEAYKRLKQIDESRMLHDCGSQEWLEFYLGQYGIGVPENAPAAGDSDHEEECESQVPEEDLFSSVRYGVNLSPQRLSKNGIASYSQKVITELKEQLENTQSAHRKLAVRSERLEVALKAIDPAIAAKVNEVQNIEKQRDHFQQELKTTKEQLATWKRVAGNLSENVDQLKEELSVYKQLFTYLGDSLSKNNPRHLVEVLANAAKGRQ